MTRGFVVLNENKTEYGYDYAYRLACERLSNIDDIEAQCARSGAQCQASGPKESIITLEFLGQPWKITHPNINVSLAHSAETVPLKDRILIVHYLALAKGTALTSKLISYKELPEGTNYFPTFWKRAIKPALDHFGKEPDGLVEVAARFGGRKIDYGDAAVTMNAFPRVPLTYVLWRGDSELPPEGNILFDSTIPDYLSIEDINVLCETVTWRLASQ